MADCTSLYIDYKSTRFFNNLVLDYLDQKAHLAPFYAHFPDLDGIKATIEAKKNQLVDRATLVKVLRAQYEGYTVSEQTNQNIERLLSDNTFTICTAHQPNLMTGYAYFIYKIMHAIKLANTLNTTYSDYSFVPVYYIGSEDDDLAELGTFRLHDQQYKWDTNQTGAVGRMDTADLAPIIAAFAKALQLPDPKALHIQAVFTYAYTHFTTITDATRYIVNELMGKYGIVVIDADHAAFKANFSDVIKAELYAPKAFELVNATNEALGMHYKHQAFVRPINFFYLKDNIRERIEQDGTEWKVINTAITFTATELEEEINTHPEYFSPNVILRGLYQETILPNIAFIGGGSEVAYWLQLKGVFDHYNVVFPTLILRQSIQFQHAASAQLQEKLGISMEDLFLPTTMLIDQEVAKNATNLTHTEDFKTELNDLLSRIKKRGVQIDANLEKSTVAALTKMEKQLDVLNHKFFKAEKKNQAILVAQLEKLKRITFPKNGLVERYNTFIPEYLAFDGDYFQYLYDHIKPLDYKFLWVKP